MSKYNNKKYEDAVENIGLWKSEKIIFNKYLNKEDKLLDIGCGTGRVTISLFKEGYINIVGLDIEEEFIKYAKNINKDIPFYCESILNTHFEDNIFNNAIFSFNGLMTLSKENQIKALNEISRILKNDGYFIFTTYDYLSYSGEKELSKQLINNNTGLTLYIPTIEEIKELIKKSNFKLIEYCNRKEIVEENELVKEFSGDDKEINTIFWIVKNNK